MATKKVTNINNTDNKQSDGAHTLRHIEFQLGSKIYGFNLNPEEYTQQEPNRVTVTQTKGGAWADDFGGGIVMISMKGTTGFKQGTNDAGRGFGKFKELRDLIRASYFDTPPGTTSSDKNELKFYNYTDNEFWVVIPKTFNLYRSISRPLMYLYDIQLICLRHITQPKEEAKKNTNTKPTATKPKVTTANKKPSTTTKSTTTSKKVVVTRKKK